MIQGMEHLPCERTGRGLGLFGLEKRRPQGDLMAAFQYLKEGYKKEGDRIFSKVWCDRTKGNGSKLKGGELDWI